MRRLVNNWLYGEVSPKITGRLDTDIYTAGCMRLENMYVHRQGGISRRPPLITQGRYRFIYHQTHLSRFL